MTAPTLACGSCLAPTPAFGEPDDPGYRLIGYCRDCGFVTVERFANSNSNRPSGLPSPPQREKTLSDWRDAFTSGVTPLSII